jgi:tRNA/tmRNA/rRNA uracil-C5-methylase (TrmA/RlmC/RlmD family)
MSKAGRAANAALETGVVADLTHEAEGVVKGEGKTVFIAGALPGERVTFRR